MSVAAIASRIHRARHAEDMRLLYEERRQLFAEQRLENLHRRLAEMPKNPPLTDQERNAMYKMIREAALSQMTPKERRRVEARRRGL